MAKIAIIGSGIVGQAMGRGFLQKNHEVIFCDSNPRVVSELSAAGLRTCLPGCLPGSLGSDCCAFFITVPTPTTNDEFDPSFIESAVANLAELVLKTQKDYFLIVVASTVIPGTTEDIVIPIIEKRAGKKAGEDFGVCHNPEFLREKTALRDFSSPWAIVIGSLDQRSGDFLETIYGACTCPIFRMSLREAELQKYVHNTFNALKISFFNEMRTICERCGTNADKIFEATVLSAEAIWNPRYGVKNLGPYEGNCLPKDVQAFMRWSQSELCVPPILIDAAERANEEAKRRRK